MNHSVPNTCAEQVVVRARKKESVADLRRVRGHRGALAVDEVDTSTVVVIVDSSTPTPTSTTSRCIAWALRAAELARARRVYAATVSRPLQSLAQEQAADAPDDAAPPDEDDEVDVGALYPHAVGRAAGDPDHLAGLGQPLAVVDGDVDRHVEDLPHLAAVLVLLQRQPVAGLHGDDLDRHGLVGDELLELPPRPLDDEDVTRSGCGRPGRTRSGRGSPRR